ncbi:MAG: hypothetical protein AAF598_20135, partial [Bacteroidota bacterium]
MVYTRELANVLVDRYHRENIALSSHVVAFVAFNLLKARNKNLDLYGLLRLAPEDRKLDNEAFKNAIEAFQKVLLDYRDHDHIKVSSKIEGASKALIEDGLQNMGIYHAVKPIFKEKDGSLTCGEMNLLYYYHNKLEGYRFDEQVRWQDYVIEEKTQAMPEKSVEEAF